MHGEFRNRIHRREELIHAAFESAFLTANALLFSLLALIALVFGINLIREFGR